MVRLQSANKLGFVNVREGGNAGALFTSAFIFASIFNYHYYYYLSCLTTVVAKILLCNSEFYAYHIYSYFDYIIMHYLYKCSLDNDVILVHRKLGQKLITLEDFNNLHNILLRTK